MIDITCDGCGRWLGKTNETTIAVMKCSNSSCKKLNNVKIVTTNSTEEQIHYVFTASEV